MSEDDVERRHQGKWDLHEVTAAEFLRNVASLFESKASTDKESWLEVYFEDEWHEQQVMRLWMESRGRDDDEPLH
jgi:hypothetical protein